MGYRDRIRAFGEFAWRAARRAVELRPDLVFATSTPLTIAIPGMIASRRLRIPFVFEVRDLWPSVPIALDVLRNPVAITAARWLERLAYRNAAHIVALSPGMKAGVIAAGTASERVTVIPNSCDCELFAVPERAGVAFRQRHRWLADRPLVVYAGTLGAVNGVSYFVQLAAAMRNIDPEVRFLIVGDGKEREAVRELADSRGLLNASVFLLDPISKREMPACLSAADVATSLVRDVPALTANSANKFFDALAAGRPIMINYGGWQAELLTRTGAGLVVPPRDPAAAAAALREFLGDAPRCMAARAAAARLAREEFSRDALALRLIEVLENVAGATRN